jgi:hypothetical protein
MVLLLVCVSQDETLHKQFNSLRPPLAAQVLISFPAHSRGARPWERQPGVGLHNGLEAPDLGNAGPVSASSHPREKTSLLTSGAENRSRVHGLLAELSPLRRCRHHLLATPPPPSPPSRRPPDPTPLIFQTGASPVPRVPHGSSGGGVVPHQLMNQYECLITNDPSLAFVVFIPFYVSLKARHFSLASTSARRRRLTLPGLVHALSLSLSMLVGLRIFHSFSRTYIISLIHFDLIRCESMFLFHGVNFSVILKYTYILLYLRQEPH